MYFDNIKPSFAEKVSNWKYNYDINTHTPTCTRIANNKYIGLYYIWDLIDTVKQPYEIYDLHFTNDTDYKLTIESIFSLSIDKDKFAALIKNITNLDIINIDKYIYFICNKYNINI